MYPTVDKKQTYILYTKLGYTHSIKRVNWRLLCEQYGLDLKKERGSQAIVEAYPDAISRLRKDHSEIEISPSAQYHKLYAVRQK